VRLRNNDTCATLACWPCSVRVAADTGAAAHQEKAADWTALVRPRRRAPSRASRQRVSIRGRSEQAAGFRPPRGGRPDPVSAAPRRTVRHDGPPPHADRRLQLSILRHCPFSGVRAAMLAGPVRVHPSCMDLMRWRWCCRPMAPVFLGLFELQRIPQASPPATGGGGRVASPGRGAGSGAAARRAAVLPIARRIAEVDAGRDRGLATDHQGQKQCRPIRKRKNDRIAEKPTLARGVSLGPPAAVGWVSSCVTHRFCPHTPARMPQMVDGARAYPPYNRSGNRCASLLEHDRRHEMTDAAGDAEPEPDESSVLQITVDRSPESGLYTAQSAYCNPMIVKRLRNWPEVLQRRSGTLSPRKRARPVSQSGHPHRFQVQSNLREDNDRLDGGKHRSSPSRWTG